jgi:hypothetical protein
MAKPSLKEFSDEVRHILKEKYQIAGSDTDKLSGLITESFALGDLPEDTAEDIGSIIAQMSTRKIAN